MRDFRATPAQRIISDIRYVIPEVLTGLAFIGFVLFLPIIGAML